MGNRWYREAVIYSLDVATFQDSDGDGQGDICGLISRLDYLARLGVTCLWLSPIHPSPGRDGGYDITDFYGIDPRIGTVGDVTRLLNEADARGMRIILDLVVNHTSDEHPWFVSASADPDSPYRDWFVWSDDEPSDRRQGMVFPGEQEETWSWHPTAKRWYYHRFYDFQPDLNWTNRAVRAEIAEVMEFWLRLGVAGFRVDAAPFIIEDTAPGNPAPPKDFELLTELRETTRWTRGDALLLAEANVKPDQIPTYLGDTGGSNNRFPMMFAFTLNSAIMLALARGDAEPMIEAIRGLPQIPRHAQWATFLRNHDEVDLSRLTADQRHEVFAAFGPKPEMQIYGRGIRRRLAPMLGGDQRRIRMAYSLQFTLPGTPVLRYGEEIGMGENLSLHAREAIRTPMQWSNSPGAGFSTADADRVVSPVIDKGAFGYAKVNVDSQRVDRDSLLLWFQSMISTLREIPEVGTGTVRLVDVPTPDGVLVHLASGVEGAVLFVHNLGPDDVRVDVGKLPELHDQPLELLADQHYDPPTAKLTGLALAGYGYRWIELDRSHHR